MDNGINTDTRAVLLSMNFRRYIVFGGASLLIHSMAFSEQRPELEIGVHSVQEGKMMSLTFVSVQAPQSEPVVEPVEKKPPVKQQPSPEQIVEDIAKPVVTPREKEVVSEPEPPVQEPIVEPVREPVKEEPQVEPVTEKTNEVEEEIAETQTEQVNFAQAAASKLIDNPTFTARPGPVNYPRQARRRGLEGTVWIEIELNADASQKALNVIESSGHSVLDEAALKDVAKWQLSQVFENGIAIAYRVQVPVRFKLN